MITLDGKYTTDMSFWVKFGAATVEDVIRSVQHLKGLELRGRLTMEDCESINRKSNSLEYLDLLHASFPDNTVPERFMSDAEQLGRLRLPRNITSIKAGAFAHCSKLGDLRGHIGR